MTKARSWMYRSIESSEFIDGVLEFYSIAVEHQVRTGGVGFYCPCVKYGHVTKVDSVDILREHILQRGFRPQYHVWALVEKNVFVAYHLLRFLYIRNNK